MKTEINFILASDAVVAPTFRLLCNPYYRSPPAMLTDARDRLVAPIPT
ncbi:hypothetical protein [Sorangium sp. So ce363]